LFMPRSSKLKLRQEGLKLSISSLAGHVCTVMPDCRSTVADVKTLIEKSADIPVREQRLVLSCRELCDSEILQTCLQGSLSIVLLRRDAETASWIEGVSMGWDLSAAPDNIRNEPEVVRAALKRNGLQFASASDDLRDDRDMAMLAIRSSGGRVFELCSKRLRGDRDLLLLALNQRFPSQALMHASDDLRNDKAFVLQNVERDRYYLCHIPSNLQDDKDVILAAVRCTKNWNAAALFVGGCPWYGDIGLPPQLLRDKHFIESAVDLGQVGFLEHAFCQHPELYQDKHFVQRLFASMLQSMNLEHPLFDARWLQEPMKLLYKMLVSYRAEENLLADKSALKLRRARALAAQCRKRARRAQQKALGRQSRSKEMNFRGGRHKTTNVEDFFL